MPKEIEICKIENGWLVEYMRDMPEMEKEDVYVYFTTKDEAVSFASNLLGD